MEADRGHVHHKLIDAGLSQKQAVLVLYGVTALLGILAVIILESNVWKVVILIAILAILSVIGTRNANDIFVCLDNGKKRNVVAAEKRNDEKILSGSVDSCTSTWYNTIRKIDLTIQGGYELWNMAFRCIR